MRNENIKRFIHNQAIKQRLMRGRSEQNGTNFKISTIKTSKNPPVPAENPLDFQLAARPIIFQLDRIEIW